MPRPGTVNRAQPEGDYWAGFPSVAIKIGGLPPSNNLASVRIHFRESVTSTTSALTLSSSDVSEIEILGASSWTFNVKPADLSSLGWGVYYYSVECTDSAGGVYTYFGGKMEILRDVTR